MLTIVIKDIKMKGVFYILSIYHQLRKLINMDVLICFTVICSNVSVLFF